MRLQSERRAGILDDFGVTVKWAGGVPARERRTAGHGPSTRIVIGEGLGFRPAPIFCVGLPGAGDDRFLAHAEIRLGGIAEKAGRDEADVETGAARDDQGGGESCRGERGRAHRA